MTAPRTAFPYDLTRITLSIATIGALAYASFWTLKPFLGAAVWATMVVVSTWPLLLRLERRFKGRRMPAVIVMSLGNLLVLAVPFTLILKTLIEEIAPVSAWAKGIAANGLPAAPDWLARVPLVGDRLLGSWNDLAVSGPDGLAAQLDPYASKAVNWLLGAVGGVGNTVVQFLIMVALAAVMYAKGEAVVKGIRAFASRLAGERGPMIVTLAGQSIRGVALGVVVTGIIQSALAGIGLAVAGVPYVVVIMLVIFIACVLQIGSIPIALAAGVWLFSQGRTTAAIFLVVWIAGAGAMNGAIRPFLIKKGGADISILIILAGVIGGVLGFGVLGIFIGPLVLAVTSTLLEAWVTGEQPADV